MQISRIASVVPEKQNRGLGRDGIVGTWLKDKRTRQDCLQTQFQKVQKSNPKNCLQSQELDSERDWGGMVLLGSPQGLPKQEGIGERW